MKLSFYDRLHYINSWFSLPGFPSLAKRLPVFFVHSSKIKILNNPQDFYDELLSRSSKAKHRIIIASLYLGTGELEKKLVSVISERLRSEPQLKLRWLLDFTRASRGENNSRKMLLPLINEKESCSRVSLFHTPRLRGLYKALIPERWNEIIGLQHMKVYIYDDSLVISGANLSNDYFVNRQDRYFVIEKCSDLADFYEGLITKVSNLSFRLKKDDTVAWDVGKDNTLHPFLGSYKQYCYRFQREIHQFWELELEKSKERLIKMYDTFKNSDQESTDDSTSEVDTLLLPTIQMPHFNIKLDSESTIEFLQSIPKEGRINLATGYFNLTEEYVDTLIGRDFIGHVSLLCAHPKANGFLGAKGFAGGIPTAYTKLCKDFYEKVQNSSSNNRIEIYEYQRDGWTFHAKGLWYFPERESTPSATLIGSPNFGFRSVYKDLETQLLLSTRSESLRYKLYQEQDRLYKDATRVKTSTFQEEDRIIPLWVKIVTYFMKFYF
ncbi:UNVERIFIED_CONTAM: hypothetical protein RMT77_014156 [Armadillidium vulgare]